MTPTPPRGEKPSSSTIHQIGPPEAIDDAAHAVVGEAAVELLDDGVGTEEANPIAGVDRGMTESDGGVRFAGPGGTHNGQVPMLWKPLQGGRVVEGGRAQRGDREIEAVQALRTGKAACLRRIRRLDSSRALHSSTTSTGRSSPRPPALGARGLADFGSDLTQAPQL